MKKILTIFLCLFTFFLLVGCDDKTPTYEEYDLSEVEFLDKTFNYDGKSHAIYVTGVPSGLEVTYEGNDKIEIGEYTVKAYIKYSTGETLLTREAILRIVNGTDLSSVTFVDETFEYDGENHMIEVENLPDGITASYTHKGEEFAGAKLPGLYVIKATLKDEYGNVLKYLAARLIITGDAGNIPDGPSIDPTPTPGPTINVDDVTFEDVTVYYDGEEHEIKCKNVPEGVIVTYLMNKQTEVGVYNAVAVLTDAKTLTEITRLFAVLTINPVKEPTPTPSGVITIYLDINWAGISQAWCNGQQMTATTNSNGIYVIEIEAESITQLELNFCQNENNIDSWWHVTTTKDNWNTESKLDVNMVAGSIYKVTNINWSHSYDDNTQKWYTCTVVEVQ